MKCMASSFEGECDVDEDGLLSSLKEGNCG